MIEISDESSETIKMLVLYIDGSRMGAASKKRLGAAEITWAVYGPQNIEKAEQILTGMMELFFQAKQL